MDREMSSPGVVATSAPGSVNAWPGEPQKSPVAAVRSSDCFNCNLRGLCLALGLDDTSLEAFANLVDNWRTVRRSEYLFRRGDRFRSLYVVRSGSFKTVVGGADGSEHIAGFHIVGETLGLDALAQGQYGCDAVALEFSSACVIPFTSMAKLCHELEPLQQQLHRVLSAEIARKTQQATMLAGRRAEQRIAAFLADLSERLQQRGYSPNDITLRMTRDEIGNHLGMRLETVSRVLAQFQREGLLRVDSRHIVLSDTDRLAMV